MKKKIVFLGLIFCLFSVSLFSQENYPLKISDITIQQKREVIASPSDIEGTLRQNQAQSFTLFEQDGLKAWVEFTPKFKGRRMKLVRNVYVKSPDGNIKKFKQKKAVQLLKVSVTGVMKGRDAAEILYDRKMRKSLFVKYNYELTY
ncbi:MAG: hypothetical protein RBR87_10065 [Bacteroidales bacterium]|jgi:hypothetical protein|nr:hypothetical protein [Bacteroidales bacterium]